MVPAAQGHRSMISDGHDREKYDIGLGGGCINSDIMSCRLEESYDDDEQYYYCGSNNQRTLTPNYNNNYVLGGGSDHHLGVIVRRPMAEEEEEEEDQSKANPLTNDDTMRGEYDQGWLQLGIGRGDIEGRQKVVGRRRRHHVITALGHHRDINIHHLPPSDRTAPSSCTRGGATTTGALLPEAVELDPFSGGPIFYPPHIRPPRPTETNSLTTTTSHAGYFNASWSFSRRRHQPQHQQLQLQLHGHNWGLPMPMDTRPLSMTTPSYNSSSSSPSPSCSSRWSPLQQLYPGADGEGPRPATGRTSAFDDAFGVKVVNAPPRPQSGIWCMLQASQNQGMEPFLPQIPKRYLRIKDGRMHVRLLVKYLVKRLGLEDESQVQIACRGQQLPPCSTLQNVRDNVWRSSVDDTPMRTLLPLPDSPITGDTSTNDQHIMLLHYYRCLTSRLASSAPQHPSDPLP